jgi:penicillin amidase
VDVHTILEREAARLAPGQSGHPLSAHWRDLAPLWAEGRHVRLAANRHELLAGTRALVLLPPP